MRDEADPARVGALLEHDGVDPRGQRGGAGGEQQQQEGGRLEVARKAERR